MLLGRLSQLVIRRSIHISPKLNQAMGIDGNTILAESLKKQVSGNLISYQIKNAEYITRTTYELTNRNRCVTYTYFCS